MRKCLAIRWSAYGDAMYLIPVLEELAKQYEYIHFETGERGKELLRHHPALSKITIFDVLPYAPEERVKVAEIRWKSLVDGNDWDKSINFIGCIETGCIADEWQDEFHWPREKRREILGARNFYDTHFAKAGLDIPEPFNTGHIWFGEEELRWMGEWRERHGDRFVVAIATNGSTAQKFPQYWKELVQEIHGAYPDTLFVLLGDGNYGKKMEFSLGQGNVLRTAGEWPYMQSLALVKMADYVIGPETGLLVGAGLFGVPKTMLCTSCSPYQATHHQVNDFSVQSTAPCSPCHRSAYTIRWCNWREHEWGGMPECNYRTDFRPIMEGVAFARDVRLLRRQVERHDGNGFGTLPDLRSLLDIRTDWHREVRRIVSA